MTKSEGKTLTMPPYLRSIEEIRSYSGDEGAAFVPAAEIKACHLNEPLDARRALRVGGVWLIETQRDPDN